ncbi:uncharacterized protein LOC115592247 [Sparus aurata]|uniref:uncharacterized protein LOC115592247 n=1 Tax=Sparus aurata TaxID=8175 RepID=UPI0011C1835E|nr:uncharacterized protein LOC115592247 [Sparus aurata]
MEAVFGLLLMLLGVSHGVETSFCDGRQDGAQCFRPLGESVALRLMDDASKLSRYQWFKNHTIILNGRKNHVMSNLMENSSSFSPSDGIFRIDNLSRTDAGEYTLHSFDLRGQKLELRSLQLTIQAPVSSVLLVSECLSQGGMRVSCSSEGADGPQYSWTLDGHTLTEAQLLSGNKDSNNITLRQDVSGQLDCSVSNHISRMSTCGFRLTDCSLFNGTHLSQRLLVSSESWCTKPTADTVASSVDHSLLICGLRAAVVTLILTGIAACYVWRKKKYETAEGSAAPGGMDQENSVVMVEMRSSASEL